MRNKFLAVLGALVIGTMSFTGCSSSSAGSEKISIIGSTTVQVPMEELANTYKEKNPNVVVEVQGVGSSAGIKAAIDKTADIGMASRELKDEEKASGITETVIAHDGIAVVVNPVNGVTNLAADQIKGIFEGTITNWSEVGGADQDIIVVTREDGSGTRSAFEELLKLQKEEGDKKISTITQSALVAEGNGTIKATVASKEGSIGYVSLGFIDDTVKAVDVDAVKATVDTVRSGEYKISRPLLILTWPEVNETVKAFMDYIVSPDGQKVVSEKYIPIN